MSKIVIEPEELERMMTPTEWDRIAHACITIGEMVEQTDLKNRKGQDPVMWFKLGAKAQHRADMLRKGRVLA